MKDKIVKNLLAVKNAFNDAAGKCTCPPGLPYCMCGAVSKGKVITRKPMLPTDEEMMIALDTLNLI